MAHGSSFRSSCEILEIEEELSSLEHYRGIHNPKSDPRTEGKDRRSLASNLGRMNSLENDLNQLFEIFNRRNSSQGMMVDSPRNGVPAKKSSSKKPIGASSSSAHESEASERASLKKGFRGLCISQASQTAAMKRSAKSGDSSKGGQGMTLYKNASLEDAAASVASQHEDKEGLLDFSFMEEESTELVIESYESRREMSKIHEALSPDRIPTEPEGPSSSPIQDENLMRTAKSSPMETPMLHKQDHPDATSSHRSDLISATHYKAVNMGSTPHPSKLEDKVSAAKGAPSAGSAKGSHVKKPNKSVSRLVKPVIKTKNFVKRKAKKDAISAHSPQETLSEFNNVLYPGSNHIVCPRCNCVVNDEWEELVEEEDSPMSPSASPGAELLSPAMRASAELSPLSAVISPCAAEMSPSNGTNKSKEDLADECSSITSISQESNQGRLSCSDRPHMSKDVRWQAIRQIRTQHGSVSLKHFNLLKKLGCGDIGTVYLAELIHTNCLFAIKVMDNEFLARRKKIVRAQTEREILRKLDHPFLPTLYSQFTSDNLSCLVMEYCPGGDLHVLRQMQQGRYFTEQATRFYVAEVLLALEYLHMLGVIYRDLKPENILVREDGHIMLSDFDLSLRCDVSPTLLVSPSSSNASKAMSGPCKNSSCVEPFCVRQPSCQVSCFGPKILRRRNKPHKLKSEPSDLLKLLPQLIAEPTDARSNSFVGTHEYLAPEIIKGEGHGSAVDWWTLGVFLYELLYGRTPFRGSGNEETLANVVLNNLKFPDFPLVSPQAKNLITELLVKDPEGRLGFERGAAEVKQHPFFVGLNWALIRCAVPPELPEFQRSNGVGKGSSNDKLSINNNKYLEYNTSTEEHLEFEVF